MKKINHGLLSLAPLVVFLLIYVTSSVLAGDFYKVPVSTVFLLACGLAVAISKGTLHQRLEAFSAGAGHPDILLMVWIFILALAGKNVTLILSAGIAAAAAAGFISGSFTWIDFLVSIGHGKQHHCHHHNRRDCQ